MTKSFFSSLFLSTSKTPSTSRKGQAALEYLSTYGFAFLGLLIALGVINSFGIFNPSSLRANVCSFPPGIACTDYIANVADNGSGPQPFVRLFVVNTYAANITVTNISMRTDQDKGVQVCDIQPPGNWDSGRNKTIWCPFGSGKYIVSQRYDGVVALNFTQAGGSYQFTTAGTFSFIGQ